ncbi:hypothetical protein Shyhy01_10810 [Streptomyces hygroscopicus subsp. hygroscopicus]|nr:hypothetical protein Shyhy01_10810 [Streptomyces hygroscopicus subsp. hygroscopicus]
MGARGPVRWGRRLVAVALAAVVGGISWWVKDRLDAQVRFAAVPSPASLVGTWKLEDVTTGQIRFTGDDRFTATALPLEVFTVPSDGTFAGGGSWSIDDGGRSVALEPDSPPSGASSDEQPSLAVVRNSDGIRLCVLSGDPGVLCDHLLRRVTT